jgi:phosphoribosylamine---glycine ligase
MKVLVVGSGGREHALVWKLKQSPSLTQVICAPGNPGIGRIARCVPIAVDAIKELVEFSLAEAIDLVVIGPEYPLSLGLTDALEAAGLKVFGPSKAAAAIEASKAFAKSIMVKAGVKTAAYHEVSTLPEARKVLNTMGLPVVLKADGLAAGKGVFVCTSSEELEIAVSELFSSQVESLVVIEEFLSGKEASFIVATDGTSIVPLAPAHDYKRIFDGDKGLNTGGMGTVSPTPHLDGIHTETIVEEVIRPVLKQMEIDGYPFRGFLFAGLMIAPDGAVNVLEFNARCGDPETESIMRRVDGDLFATLYALSSKEAHEVPALSWSSDAVVTVILASKGYPESSSKGDVITGVDLASAINGVEVFHCGTALNEKSELLTAGGRVLAVSGTGATIEAARQIAYRGADMIQFSGRQLRRDIGKH